MKTRSSGLLMILALHSSRALAAEPVDDGTRNAARNLAEQGRDAFEHGNFERSRDLFHRAYALVQAPTLALYEARSLNKLGRLVQAEEAYLRVVRTSLQPDAPEPFRKAVREAESEEVLLEPRIPKLTIIVIGPGAESPDLSLTLDGEKVKAALIGVEMPLDPGHHAIQALVPGAQPSRVELEIQERDRKRVEIRVEAPRAAPVAAQVLGPPITSFDTPPPRSSWHTPAALAAGGLGVVGLGTGLVAGLLAGARHAKAEEQCPNHACVEGSEGEAALSSFRTLRTVSTVGYIVGAAGLAAGVTLFVTAPSAGQSTRQARLGLWLNAGSAGLTGAF